MRFVMDCLPFFLRVKNMQRVWSWVDSRNSLYSLYGFYIGYSGYLHKT